MIYYKPEIYYCFAHRNLIGDSTHYYTLVTAQDNWVFPISVRDAFFKQLEIFSLDDIFRKSVLDNYSYKNKRFENIER